MADERVDYTSEAVKAARSVIIELVHILGEYRTILFWLADGFRICSCHKARIATSEALMSIWR